MPEMFTLNMLQGRRNALNDPSSIFISYLQQKLFLVMKTQSGKILKIDDMTPVKVAGVYKDFPHNSALAKLDFIAHGISGTSQ